MKKNLCKLSKKLTIQKTIGGKREMDKLFLNDICKTYNNFQLKNVKFKIPKGSVVGLIGENGAGKTTIIKSILNIVKPDKGEILFNNKNISTLKKCEKQKIAFVLDDCGLPQELNLHAAEKVYSKIFVQWNSEVYHKMLKKMQLPLNKPIKEFSKGMKMKAAIAVAFSYESELLVLDEPTGGLDPVVRDEIIKMIYDYNTGNERAVLISSHITSDLEKICDYIVYLHEGVVEINQEKDELLQNYAVYSVTNQQLQELNKTAVVRILKREYGTDVLALKSEMPKNFAYKTLNLDDLMLFFSKGEKIC